MNIKEKIIRFLPIFSILSVLFLSISTKTVSATTIGRAAGYSREVTIDDILKPIIRFFQALLNFILSPFKAIQQVFTSWGNGLYNQVGIWAPLVAIIIVVMSLFMIVLFMRFRRYIPGGS